MDSGPERLDELADQADAELMEARLNLRTRVCIWIIVVGLANFLAYTVAYFSLPGEAIHGGVRLEPVPSGGRLHYYLLNKGSRVEVSRGVWLYSAVHSTSIPITVGAVLLAMLTLAKDRIVSSMRSSVVRGRTFITVLAAVVTVCSLGWMGWFLYVIIGQLAQPAPWSGR